MLIFYKELHRNVHYHPTVLKVNSNDIIVAAEATKQ